jgi:hypothetical protein
MTTESHQKQRDYRTGARGTLDARLEEIVKASVEEVVQSAKRIVEAARSEDARRPKGKIRDQANPHS